VVVTLDTACILCSFINLGRQGRFVYETFKYMGNAQVNEDANIGAKEK
jgi:hypothetical protein